MLRRRRARPAERSYGELPLPASELRAWLAAGCICTLGAMVLAATLAGWIGGSPSVPLRAPPAVLFAASTPTAQAQPSSLRPLARRTPRPRPQSRTRRRQRADRLRAVLAPARSAHITAAWMSGFYRIYEVAQSTFGVNWLLLASIHEQETSFSTDPTTYHGLNYAGCCGGPMQFNVTNGPVSTWMLVADSYIYGKRPAQYAHRTEKHPSIYDDFDSIMAAAHLLSANGADYRLDQSAWSAAYDYYGHDADGVSYADQVLARAIGWSQRGFCLDCGMDPATLQAVHRAWGEPVLASLENRGATAIVARRVRR